MIKSSLEALLYFNRRSIYSNIEIFGIFLEINGFSNVNLESKFDFPSSHISVRSSEIIFENDIVFPDFYSSLGFEFSKLFWNIEFFEE